MNWMRNTLLATCLLAISLIALTACGGDDDSEDSDSNVQATATAATDDESPPTEEATEPADEPTDEPQDDDSDSSGGETVSDPCSLITQSEVEAALGDSVQAPVVTYTGTAGISGSTEQANIGTCSYVSGESISSVNVNVWSAPGADDAIQEMAEVACANKEEISDRGDLACWYDDQHVEIQLADRSYFLDIFATDDTDTTEALLSLSETAVSRLP